MCCRIAQQWTAVGAERGAAFESLGCRGGGAQAHNDPCVGRSCTARSCQGLLHCNNLASEQLFTGVSTSRNNDHMLQLAPVYWRFLAQFDHNSGHLQELYQVVNELLGQDVPRTSR